MLEKFLAFIDKNKLPAKDKRILLAVSGGVDSAVMTHLFSLAGYHCIVAHCNFQLRGADSDEDEVAAKKLAVKAGFEFVSKNFETENYANLHTLSIQEAARNLRYSWFHTLCEENGLEAIATAHHSNDVAETMLLNLVRGAGLAGMHGIPVENGKVIRPLLFLSRKEIEEYAQSEKLTWREDASNLKNEYSRNKIRNLVIPLLTEINPQVIKNFNRHAEHVKNYELLTAEYIRDITEKLVIAKYDGMFKLIYKKNLLSYPAPEYLLFLILSKYGFNETICREIITNERTGSEFMSADYKLIVDREELVLFRETDINDNKEYTLDELHNKIKLKPGTIATERVQISDFNNKNEPADFRKKGILYLDSATVTFPFLVKRWREGDSFLPYGMKGRKLISDFLTDEKMSGSEKKIVYLLFKDNEVLWVVGSRASANHNISTATKEAIKFTFQK